MFLGIGAVFKLFFYGFIIYLVWRFLQRSRGDGYQAKEPLAIIQERYARGELSREEYYRLKEDLEKK